jgi:hypothetical protein
VVRNQSDRRVIPGAAELSGQRARQVGVHEVFVPSRLDAAVPLAIGGVSYHGVPVGIEDEGTSTGPQYAARLGQCRRHSGDVLTDLGRHGASKVSSR